MLFRDMPKHKKIETYISLISTGLIDNISNKDTERYGITKDTLVNDLETNFNNLLLTVNNPNNNLVSQKLEEKKKLSIVDTNTMPSGFKWSVDNIPMTNPDYFIYDNESGTRWNSLKNVNSYPKVIGNKKSINKQGEDNFTTYNNITYRDRFRHEQKVILPIMDRTMDGWFDTGIKSIPYYQDVPYSSLYFQKEFYVWYIKGDGTDYPYTGQVRYSYPGQFKNYPYKYENLGEVLIGGGSTITVKGENTFKRFKTKYEGFDLRLDRPNTYSNTLVKIDMGLTEQYGQMYHYQGATIKCYPVFKDTPTKIKLDMRGEDRTLDITTIIETNLTWEFDRFSIVSADENKVRVEHDWNNEHNDPKSILGPSYIRLIGGDEGITTLTITAQPKDSNYVEVINIEVTVEQLYKGVTTLEVDPASWVFMVNETLNFNVRTNAASYTIVDPIKKFIRLTPTSVTGIKEGTGIVTIKAQADRSMPAYAKVPYLVTKYIPKPIIIKNFESLSVNSLSINEYNIKTNIPKDKFKVTIEDETYAVVDNIVFGDEVEYDQFNSPYVYRQVKLTIRGLKEGSTFLKIVGYIKDGEEATKWILPVKVEPEIVKEVIIPQPDDVLKKVNSRPDTYLTFHHQHEGVFTYLRSKGYVDPNILNNIETIVDEQHNANKIFIMPKVTPEDIAKFKTDTFTLALVEDLNGNNIPGEIGNNPNYIDFKRSSNPYDGFLGNTTKDVGQVYINYITLERFISKKNEIGNLYWEGNKGTYITDKHYPYPGEKGFGVGPCPNYLANIYNLTPLPGCEDRYNPNYGNYRTITGSIFVYIPIMYFKYNVINNKLIDIDVYYPLKDDDGNVWYRDKNGDIVKGTDSVVYNGKTMRYTDVLVKSNAYLDSEYGIFVEKYLLSNRRNKPINNLLRLGNNKRVNYFASLTLIDRLNRSEFSTLYRANEDVMFSTPHTRELINVISIAHGLSSLTHNNTNNKWLDTPYGMPNNKSDINYNISNILEGERLSINSGVINPDIINYGYTNGYSSHNGQTNGIQDVNNSALEITTGCRYSLDDTNYVGAFKYNIRISDLKAEYNVIKNIDNNIYSNFTNNITELLGNTNYNSNKITKKYSTLLDMRLITNNINPQTNMKFTYTISNVLPNKIRGTMNINSHTVFNNTETNSSSLSNKINIGNNVIKILK